MEHTKGGWIVSKLELENYFSITVHSTTEKDSNGDAVCIMHRKDNPKEMEANAKLIAAAPELLEALKEIAEQKNAPISGFERSIKIAEQAIKKATTQ